MCYDVKHMIEKEMRDCHLCPRDCGVNRTGDNSGGKFGVCGQSDKIKVAKYSLHMWEEPCISGSKGSGTVFFSGCSLGCVFCQNSKISNPKVLQEREALGKEVSVEELAEIFLKQQYENHANNINLVTATHFLPQVIAALDRAKNHGLTIPIVYNCSGYEQVEGIKRLEGYVDVYLPDFKYISQEMSLKYSHVRDYAIRAKAALQEMVRQCKDAYFYVEGDSFHERISPKEYQDRCEEESLLMGRGVIVRHLMLPNGIEDSKAVMQYLLNTYKEQIFISVMNQYTPLPQVSHIPELNQKVAKKDYEELLDFAINLGMEYGFFQEGDVAMESFIPDF